MVADLSGMRRESLASLRDSPRPNGRNAMMVAAMCPGTPRGRCGLPLRPAEQELDSVPVVDPARIAPVEMDVDAPAVHRAANGRLLRAPVHLGADAAAPADFLEGVWRPGQPPAYGLGVSLEVAGAGRVPTSTTKRPGEADFLPVRSSCRDAFDTEARVQPAAGASGGACPGRGNEQRDDKGDERGGDQVATAQYA